MITTCPVCLESVARHTSRQTVACLAAWFWAEETPTDRAARNASVPDSGGNAEADQ